MKDLNFLALWQNVYPFLPTQESTVEYVYDCYGSSLESALIYSIIQSALIKSLEKVGPLSVTVTCHI